MQQQNIPISTLVDISNLSPRKPSNGKPENDKVAVVIEDLARRHEARPRTLKTLRSTVQAPFRKELSEEDLTCLLNQLSERGINKVTGGMLTYGLPTQPREGL